MHTDAELWISFSEEGNKESFSIFYKQNYARLFSYGNSLGMDEEQIRDTIQELFLKLYTKPHLIKELSTIQAFLFASIRNAFINHKKLRKKYLGYHEVENFELTYSIENNILENEEEILLLKERINKIIESLTPRQKEIIYLRFLHQMDYEEISQIMNMSSQAARNLIYRAMEKIRKENPNILIWIFLLLLPK